MCVTPKNTFGWLDDQTMFHEMIKEKGEVTLVLLFILAGYQDVVKVDKNEVEITTHPIHHPLEGLCSILQPEGHA